ncbi:hypothetical protein ACIFOT_17115 [Neobacillus sp. NRS-1170]|uniref:hypothetical protein n=1 Tax=Neobacillus sp. NRS-1170 TaxID=3233898 RepID=UPI003D295B6A
METLVFLIIIGILSSIFGKKKGKKRPIKSKSFSMNTLDDLRNLFQDETERRIHPVQEKKNSHQPKQQDLEKKYLQIKQDSDVIQKGFTNPANLGQLKKEKPKDPLFAALDNDGELEFETPNPNSIINGIIWSEILGEPRSRKPYFPRKRQAESE